MIPVSLFKCVSSHANVVLCVLCVACINGCFVYIVLTHALVLQWACVLVPTVTILCTNVLCLNFPNYAQGCRRGGGGRRGAEPPSTISRGAEPPLYFLQTIYSSVKGSISKIKSPENRQLFMLIY